MSDQSRGINFPPAVPLDRPNQYQKDFFIGVQTAQADTAANLAAANIVLLKGQIGLETDTNYFKLGDGATAYNSLPYQPQYGKVAPLPQSGAAAGHWLLAYAGSGAAYALPAGGSWSYFLLELGAVAYSIGGYCVASVSAGGTTIGAATAGYIWIGFAYEILDANGFDSSKPIYPRKDGSFIITSETGHPYHVLTHEQADALFEAEKQKMREAGRPESDAKRVGHDALYDKVAAFVTEHPEALAEEPQPEPPKIDPDQQLRMEIAAANAEEEYQNALKDPKWQARKATLCSIADASGGRIDNDGTS